MDLQENARLVFHPTFRRNADAYAGRYYGSDQFIFKECNMAEAKIEEEGVGRIEFWKDFSAAVTHACSQAYWKRSSPVLLMGSSRVLAGLEGAFVNKYSIDFQKPVPRKGLITFDVPLREGFTLDYNSHDVLTMAANVDYDLLVRNVRNKYSSQKSFRVSSPLLEGKDLHRLQEEIKLYQVHL